MGLELRLLHHVRADLLGRFAQLFEVGVARERQVELHGRPVATEIRDLSQRAEGNGMDLSVLVAQADGAQSEAFDRTLGAATVDVFADAEGIIGEIEHARDDVAHECLAAEGDRKAEDGGACQQRADVDAEIAERNQERSRADEDRDHDADHRHQRVEAGGDCAGCRVARGFLVLPGDPTHIGFGCIPEQLPHDEGREQRDADGPSSLCQAVPCAFVDQPQHVDYPAFGERHGDHDQHRYSDAARDDVGKLRSLAGRRESGQLRVEPAHQRPEAASRTPAGPPPG